MEDQGMRGGEESESSRRTSTLGLEAESDMTITLAVKGKRLLCSASVIQSSSLLSDLLQLVDDDQEPVPVPDWISLQIMQDLMKILEMGDTECAHLVLVSLSYLLDFLIAVDFLGCTDIKTVLESRIKDKLNESNWRETFHYTKDIIGLSNTTHHSIEIVCKQLVQPNFLLGAGHQDGTPHNNQTAIMEGRPEAHDPYKEDYIQFPAVFFKEFLRYEELQPEFKLFLLSQWVEQHSAMEEDIVSLVSALPLQGFKDGQVVAIVGGWGLSEEAMEEVAAMVQRAEKEREKKRRPDEEERRQKWEEKYKVWKNKFAFFGIGVIDIDL